MGSKGGQTTSAYFNHVAIDVGQGPLDVDFVDRIYANGQLIYKANPHIEFTSQLLEVTDAHWIEWDWADELDLTLSSLSGGPDLTQLVPGVKVTMTGWVNSDYNGTFDVLDVLPNPANLSRSIARLAKIIAYAIGSNAGPTPDETASADITVTQDPPRFDLNTFAAIATYNGTATQAPDAQMEAAEGVGKVPARRGRAYIVLSLFNITKFGNSMPNFEVVATPHSAMTLAGAIDLLLGRVSSLSPSDWDTSGVTGSFDGGVIEEPIDTLGVLQVIMMAYQLGAREVDGKLVFHNRVNPDQVAVAQEDLSARAEGSDAGNRLIGFNDVVDAKLPYRLEVEYSNMDGTLEPAVARDTTTHVLDGSKSVKRVRLPLSLTQSRAACIARIMMLSEFAERQARTMAIPPLYKHVSEGDHVLTTVDGVSETTVVKKLDYGRNGLVAFDGVRAQPHIMGITAADCPVEDTIVGTSNDDNVSVPPVTNLFLTDVCPLSDFDAENPGMRVGIPLLSPNTPYQGVFMFRQLGPGLDFLSVQYIVNQSRQGYVPLAGSPSLTASPAYWDEASVLNVFMSGGAELETATAAAVIGGANRAFYGGELLAFRAAVLQADGSYNLTGLLRGLRGTEGAIGGHSILYAEPFTLVGNLQFQELPASSYQGNLGLKAVPSGTDEADAPANAFIPQFGSMMPFPVYGVRAVRNDLQDLAVTWDRQTRRNHPLFAPVADPLLEPAVSYEIDVVDGSDVVVRTFATSLGALAYDAGQQTADGLTPGDPVHMKIYQMSATLGRGKEKDITL